MHSYLANERGVFLMFEVLGEDFLFEAFQILDDEAIG
jgi:hypothetical protein